MTRLTKNLVVILLFSLSSSVLAYRSFPAMAYRAFWSPRYCAYVPATRNQLNILVEGMYVSPSISQLDYATLTKSSTLLNASSGEVSSVEPDYEWGYHINFGILYNCWGDINIHVRWLNTDDTDHVNVTRVGVLTSTLVDTPPVTATIDVTDAFLPTFTFIDTLTPLIATTAAYTEASAASKTQFRNIDVEFGKSLNVGNRMLFRFFDGVRFLDLHHTLSATYTGSAEGEVVQREFSDLETDSFIANITPILEIESSVKEKTRVEGIGPRVGVDSEFKLCTGVNVTAHLGTALIVGQSKSAFNSATRSNYTVTLTPIEGTVLPDPVTLSSVTTTTNSFKHKTDQVIPNWDLKLGVKLQSMDCHHHKYSLEAGYLVDHYYNVVDRFTDLNSLDTPLIEVLDTSFKGPYLNVQVEI